MVTLNQDPRLRAMIMPIFKFNPQQASDRPFGLGTTFRIDPWGNCATAFHVIEDMLLLSKGEMVLRDDIRMAALELEGIALGAAPLPNNAWRPLLGFYAEAGVITPPLLHQKPYIKNMTELARLHISRSHNQTKMPCMPMALRNEPPAVGDYVTGYGFAGLDIEKDGMDDDNRPFSQYLYQSGGEILEVKAVDPEFSMLWPQFRVNAEWPSGMSGGPIVNAAGNVIGIISRGWSGEPESTATHFAGWDIAERTYPTIDPFSPRRYRGYAALDDKDDVQFLHPDSEKAEAFAKATGMIVRAVSCNLENGDWIEL